MPVLATRVPAAPCFAGLMICTGTLATKTQRGRRSARNMIGVLSGGRQRLWAAEMQGQDGGAASAPSQYSFPELAAARERASALVTDQYGAGDV